jgi:decaprenyl-phosphate phosphoribosyltransferase
MWLGLLRTMRPHQWVKNLFVLAPLLFAKELFVAPALLRSLAAFAAFCMAAGAVYILNDVVDIEADRSHPIKSRRPIPSGLVPVGHAKQSAIVLVILAVGGAALLDLGFAAATLAYLLLNLAYSFRLKHLAYIDVMCIAGGFELRVLAGAAAAAIPASSYLLIVTFLLSAFLGLGKRMHELKQGEQGLKQRASLRAYAEKPLAALLYLFALATVATYTAYTLDPDTRAYFGTDHLVVTTAFTLFGVWRFLQLVQSHPHTESPTEEMLRDAPFLANLVLWTVAISGLIYFS